MQGIEKGNWPTNDYKGDNKRTKATENWHISKEVNTEKI